MKNAALAGCTKYMVSKTLRLVCRTAASCTRGYFLAGGSFSFVMPKLIEITGQRFGRLIVIGLEPIRIPPGRQPKWMCLCECGATTFVESSMLRRGRTRSCGCLKRTHGHTVGGMMSGTYRTWRDMLGRCCDPKRKEFERYGGRGISICDRWRSSFADFLADMGEKPPGLTIERINNNGNYCKENCRWATVAEQNRNQRRNHWILVGNETKTLTDWSIDRGVPRSTIHKRLAKGWLPDRAVTERPGTCRAKNCKVMS
jgi:hypothetical protein